MNERTFEGQYAGFVTRAFGLVLDYAILTVALIVLFAATTALFNAFGIDLVSCQGLSNSFSPQALACSGGHWFLAISLVLVYPLYYILFWMLVGQTIGQRVMGVRVVRLDGHNIGFKRSLLRWIGSQICVLTLGIGFLWVLVDDQRRGWHDLLGRTCVVYSWRAVQKERFMARLAARLRRKRTETVSTETPSPDGNPVVQEQLPG